jgi:hypothetical protein
MWRGIVAFPIYIRAKDINQKFERIIHFWNFPGFSLPGKKFTINVLSGNGIVAQGFGFRMAFQLRGTREELLDRQHISTVATAGHGEGEPTQNSLQDICSFFRFLWR